MYAVAARSVIERFRPRYSGITPLTKPAIILPAECADRSTPLSVSESPYAAFRSGITDPMVSDRVPLQKKAKKQVNSSVLSVRESF